MLFAMEEFPQLRSVIDWGFDKPENINVVSSSSFSFNTTLEIF
jgi:hypothetical protein